MIPGRAPWLSIWEDGTTQFSKLRYYIVYLKNTKIFGGFSPPHPSSGAPKDIFEKPAKTKECTIVIQNGPIFEIEFENHEKLMIKFCQIYAKVFLK